jgi:hypothetical protein
MLEQILNLERKYRTKVKKVHEFQALFDLLKDHDVHRLPAILSTCVYQRKSVCAITERLREAITGVYRPLGNFSKRELDIGLLSLRLGGYRLLFALSEEFGLPSIRTVMREHVNIDVLACISTPDDETLIRNVQEVFMAPRIKTARPRVGVHIALDETALDPGAGYSPRHESVSGICPCTGQSDDELDARTLAPIMELSEKMFPEDDTPPCRHFATEATVAAVSLLGAGDYRAVPIVVAPVCGSKKAEAFVEFIVQQQRVWRLSGAQEKYGPIWSVGTDGAAPRRKGGTHYCLKEDVSAEKGYGKKLHQLPGMNLKVGPEDITLDFDWKHLIKRESQFCLHNTSHVHMLMSHLSGFGTQIRCKKGMFLLNKAVTAQLIATYLHRVGFRRDKIKELLKLKDGQNVPAAIELVEALEKVANIPRYELTLSEYHDQRAIGVFAEIFGSYVHGFSQDKSSLTEQMALLSKYSHLVAYFYREGKTSFMQNELYYDSMTCVKNAFFCLAKQQDLDPTQAFYLFLLGSDGIEKLFAYARMAGGHSPNFSFDMLAQRLGEGVDIARIMAEYPEWYSGHRRLTAAYGKRTDKLSPPTWEGDAIAGHCDIIQAWLCGANEASKIIFNYTNNVVNFQAWFSDQNADILWPLGGGPFAFPGVKSLDDPTDDEEDNSAQTEEMSMDEILVNVPHAPGTTVETERIEQMVVEVNPQSAEAVQTSTTNIHVAQPHDVNPASSSQLDPSSNIRSNNDLTSKDSAEEETAAQLSSARRHSIWMDPGWVHRRSVVTKVFNARPHIRHPKERLRRVRNHPEADTSHIKYDDDSFTANMCIATLVRCDTRAFLALVQATYLTQRDEEAWSVRKSEVSLPEANVTIRGQILKFEPALASNGAPCFAWHGHFARLRAPSAKASTTDSRLEITLPGHACIPVQLPKYQAAIEGSLDLGWRIPSDALKQVGITLWEQIRNTGLAEHLPELGVGLEFPYCLSNGECHLFDMVL